MGDFKTKNKHSDARGEREYTWVSDTRAMLMCPRTGGIIQLNHTTTITTVKEIIKFLETYEPTRRCMPMPIIVILDVIVSSAFKTLISPVASVPKPGPKL